ncbi:MAG: RNA polymerase sigma factor [Nitriliruptoraceae bacterium]
MSGAMDARDDTDEELLARYLSPSGGPGVREAAFHTLVDRYHRRVFGICLHTLGSASDAEDATQETFLKLARHADSFRGEAKLSTWLYRVARNVCTDHVRHDARRPSTPVADPSTLDEAPSEADRTSGTEDALSVRTALAQLDAGSRQALILVAVEGLSYQEAGAALGLAVGTVKSRVSRARTRLAALLAEAAPTGDAESRPAATPPRPDTSYP